MLALLRASALGSVGRYQFGAATQSSRVIRRRTGRADWAAIEKLYDSLLTLTSSPVVAINRAVAIAETRGPTTSLEALYALSGAARLAEYRPHRAAHRVACAQRLTRCRKHTGNIPFVSR